MADKSEELAGTQRAAILLMSLGEQDAANVLKQLDANPQATPKRPAYPVKASK